MAKKVLQVFQEYYLLSGLQLNMDKVVVVPLWIPNKYARHGVNFIGPRMGRLDIIKRAISNIYAGWGEAKFEEHAAYLGFVIGPGAGRLGWDKAVLKTMKKVQTWRSTACSLLYTVMVYNVYILPILSFITQLEPPPDSWETTERRIMARLIRGPGNWAGPKEWRQLKRAYQFPAECHNLRERSSAAQFRVACNEARAEGGLGLTTRVEKTDRALRHTTQTHLFAEWGTWLNGGFSRQLDSNKHRLEGHQTRPVTAEIIESTLLKDTSRPWNKKDTRKVISKTQATCLSILAAPPAGAEAKMRKDIEKITLSAYPRTSVGRAFRVLEVLKRWGPPRVLAAHYRSWWNGWTTSHRLHNEGGIADCFWCGLRQGDSLTHICVCPVIQEWRCSTLGLTHETALCDRRAQFFNLLRVDDGGEEAVMRRGIALAATYHAHNNIRAAKKRLTPTEACRSLTQSAKETVMGNQRLELILDFARAPMATTARARRLTAESLATGKRRKESWKAQRKAGLKAGKVGQRKSQTGGGGRAASKTNLGHQSYGTAIAGEKENTRKASGEYARGNETTSTRTTSRRTGPSGKRSKASPATLVPPP